LNRPCRFEGFIATRSPSFGLGVAGDTESAEDLFIENREIPILDDIPDFCKNIGQDIVLSVGISPTDKTYISVSSVTLWWTYSFPSYDEGELP